MKNIEQTLCVLAVGLLVASGCGKADSAQQVTDESPEAAAKRVFGIAQSLEMENKTKQSFAAYRQVAERFPQTPEGQKAAKRIRNAQKSAVTGAKKGR